MGSLNHFITEYNKREFRFEEDTLSGIFELLFVVSRSFIGGFIYGVSEMLFDRGLS